MEVVSFTPRPIYPKKRALYPLYRRLGGPLIRSGRFGEKKNILNLTPKYGLEYFVGRRQTIGNIRILYIFLFCRMLWLCDPILAATSRATSFAETFLLALSSIYY
jgi:hypothetical protein